VVLGQQMVSADDSAATAGAVAVIHNAAGATIATVSLQRTRQGTVQVSVRASGLTAGFHGFHVHTVGVCDPATTNPDGTAAPFLSAGGHFNPGNATHANHAGDLPTLLARTSGGADTTVVTDRFTIDSLFDADGSAIIVHAGQDNQANIPTRYSAAGVPGPDAATLATGDAGARFGCGVVTRVF
jgi:Cu-Zn family superoxide dismutase